VVTKVKLNIHSVKIHPHLRKKGHPVDGGCFPLSTKKKNKKKNSVYKNQGLETIHQTHPSKVQGK
jgi:hypothetical protein